MNVDEHIEVNKNQSEIQSFSLTHEGLLSKAREVIDSFDNSDLRLKFNYQETIHPFDPRKTQPQFNDEALKLLEKWTSVRDSIRASIQDSMWDSIRVSVYDSVHLSIRDSIWSSLWTSVRTSIHLLVWSSLWSSIWTSIRASIHNSVLDSIWISVWASVRDSESAYIGTLFPQIKKWKYVNFKYDNYPFSSAVELLKRGLVPVYDSNSKKWYLLGGQKMEIIWYGTFYNI